MITKQELIKRVRLTEEEKAFAAADELERTQDCPDEMMGYSDIIICAQLNKFLNYPDLYLQITGEPILTMDLGAGDESYCAVDYIPLSELGEEIR